MKPYYEGAGITLYCGDARAILPLTRREGDVVISDPPYNIGYHYEGYTDAMDEDDYWNMLGEVLTPRCILLHYPEAVFKFAFQIGEFPDKCVAWVYPANTPRQWRMISWFGCKPDLTKIKQPYRNPTDKRIKALIAAGSEGGRLYDWWEIPQVKNVSAEKTAHPCQIPEEMMRRVLATTDATRFIDPFAGSGTTLATAAKLGKSAIGIELDERYCEIIAMRLTEGKAGE